MADTRIPIDAIGEMFAPDQYALPQISLESRDFATPRVGIDLTTPFAGGTLGATGGYQQQPGRPDWSARLQYRRQF